jgi:hypothetical protein
MQQEPPDNDMVLTAKFTNVKTGEVIIKEVARAPMLNLHRIRTKPFICSCGWMIIKMGGVVKLPKGKLIYTEPEAPLVCGACGKLFGGEKET